MVEVGTGTRGTRFVNKNYPVDEGLIAGTTKQVNDPRLIPEEQSLVSKREEVGL